MMSDLTPVSITPDTATFLYRSIRLEFSVSPTSRVLTAVFDNDPTRSHTASDWLHAEEIRDLLVYFGFNGRGTVTAGRSGGRIEFRQKLITVSI